MICVFLLQMSFILKKTYIFIYFSGFIYLFIVFCSPMEIKGILLLSNCFLFHLFFSYLFLICSSFGRIECNMAGFGVLALLFMIAEE